MTDKRNYWTSVRNHNEDRAWWIAAGRHHTESDALEHANEVSAIDGVPVRVYEDRGGALIALTTVYP